MMERFAVSTPIYYVNDVPHIGHVYSTCVADTLARYQRRKLGRERVWFSTGTDENSQKTVEAAAKRGLDIEAYLDELSATWRTTFERLGIDFNDFIRTTEFRHKEAVEAFLVEMEQSGDIYRGHYEGWYCVGHEAFMKASELVDGKCPDHNRKAEWLKEENYFFRLSKYQGELLHWYADHPQWIVPEKRFNEVKQFVRQGLEDISITRATQRWGIPLPSDPQQVIYVWIDALINYLTTLGYPDERYREFWPSTHVIGKDIIKFHCVIWPAMLLSAKLEPPRQVLVNGFFTVDGQKMGKSLGNVVDPLPLAERYGSDALRYFLLREIPFGEDGDFSETKFRQRYESDLANGLGNLVSRVTNMIEKFAAGKFEAVDVPEREQTQREIDGLIAAYQLERALVAVWRLVESSNVAIDAFQPWKQPAGSEALRTFLSQQASAVLWIADLLEPFLPASVVKIRQAFQQPVKKIEPLFPRLP